MTKKLDFWKFSKQFAGPSYTTNTQMTPLEAFSYNESWANRYFSYQQYSDYLSSYPVDCLTNTQYT